MTMKVFNRENWDAANERLTYFLRELADDGYRGDLIADVTMAAGVVLIDEVFGREALVPHLGRLALTAMDPRANMVTGPKFLQ
jgi:hypothetical protein